MINEQTLTRSPLFRNLSSAECALVMSIGQVRNHGPEQVLFREGDSGDGLFIILEGGVRISKQGSTGEEALAILEAPAFFGEMALIDQSKRAADAITHSAVTLFFLPLLQLQELIEAHPPIAIKILYALCEVLAQRLRETNEHYMSVFTIAQWGGAMQNGLILLP